MAVISMDEKKLNEVIGSVSNKIGDVDSLKKAAKSGDIEGVMKVLTPEQAEMFKKVIGNKEEAQKLLSSPQAIALMKALSGK